MSKRKSSRANKRPLKSLMSAVTRTAGKFLKPLTLVNATLQVIPVNPFTSGFGTHLEGFGELFGQYRFTRLALKLFPAAANISLAYLPDSLIVSSPSTFLQMSELADSEFHSSNQIVPTYHTLGRRALIGNNDLRWVQTRESGADGNFTTQGNILILADANVTAHLEVTYEVEFCGPRSTGSYLRQEPVRAAAAAPLARRPASMCSMSSYLTATEEKEDPPSSSDVDGFHQVEVGVDSDELQVALFRKHLAAAKARGVRPST